MQVIDQSFEFLHVTPFPTKLIEEVGRTAYKSHSRTTTDSDIAFVQKMIDKNHGATLEFADITVRVFTDRAVSHELVRHRIASYLQESQRYVKYQGDMAFIKPTWATSQPEGYEMWCRAMQNAETDYCYMVGGLNMKAEDARDMLPNSTATAICIKRNMRAWREFFELRTASDALPKMRALATSMLLEMAKRIPVIFDDLAEKADRSIPLAKCQVATDWELTDWAVID